MPPVNAAASEAEARAAGEAAQGAATAELAELRVRGMHCRQSSSRSIELLQDAMLTESSWQSMLKHEVWMSCAGSAAAEGS